MATRSRIVQKLQCGDVKRYHTRPKLIIQGQDVAQHSWRASMIGLALWPDLSRDAIIYLLMHDNAEATLGDMPAMVKRDFPSLARAYLEAENEVDHELGTHAYYDDLTPEEVRKVKICDLLELVMLCYEQLLMGNTLAMEGYKRGTEWLRLSFSQYPEFVVVEELLREISLHLSMKEPT